MLAPVFKMDVLKQIIVLLFTASYIADSVADDILAQELVKRIEALERYKCVQQDETIDKNEEHESIQSLRADLHQMKQDLDDKENRIQYLENVIKTSMPLNAGQQDWKLKNDAELMENTDALVQPTVHSQNEGYQVENSKEAAHVRPGRLLFAGQPVGFHAVNTVAEAHLGAHQPLVFDTVLTNLGSAFHASHGIFIAPIHGVYMFSVSASSAGEAAHQVIAAEMVKDGNLLAKTYAKSDTGYIDQGSVTVVTEMQPGNEVWVRLNHPLDTTLAAGYFSSFTGILVYEYEA